MFVIMTLLENILAALRSFRLGVRPALSPGLQVLSRNIYLMPKFSSRKLGPRGDFAVEELLRWKPQTILDVGAGDLHHARLFADAGCQVSAIDLGISIYASNRGTTADAGLSVVDGDFLAWDTKDLFDAVFASHVLEHQANPVIFLKKVIERVYEGGLICLVLPFPQKEMVSGHVGWWSPGQVVYNLVLAGTDTSQSLALESHGEFLVIVRKKAISIEDLKLHYDSGDLEKLAPFLPTHIKDEGDSFRGWNHL